VVALVEGDRDWSDMDKDIIQQIAAAVVAQLPYGDRPWLFWLINAAIVALAGLVGTWGGSYLRTRGQHLATKHDFDSLQNQLKANTKLVETIKSEVGQREWAQREWTNLRRVKLETLLEKMHECETYLDQLRRSCLGGTVIVESDPFNELDAIGTLYFRELNKEVARFYLNGRAQMEIAYELGKAINRAGNDIDARQSAFDTFQGKWSKLYQEFAAARSALTVAARSLLERIMDVDERLSTG
jgi:hypothetical protein